MEPAEFEEFVAKLFSDHLGWDAVRVGGPNDGGIDIHLHRPSDSRTAIAQCKRYSGQLGPAVVRELYGALVHCGAAEAYLVTSSMFSLEAQAFARDKPIILVD